MFFVFLNLKQSDLQASTQKPRCKRKVAEWCSVFFQKWILGCIVTNMQKEQSGKWCSVFIAVSLKPERLDDKIDEWNECEASRCEHCPLTASEKLVECSSIFSGLCYCKWSHYTYSVGTHVHLDLYLNWQRPPGKGLKSMRFRLLHLLLLYSCLPATFAKCHCT